MTIVIHAIVRGKVQGVSFRQSTRQRALQLGITGWVRNLPDGAVEVKARGEPSAIDALREWLACGPPHARVDEVFCDMETDSEGFVDFVITR